MVVYQGLSTLIWIAAMDQGMLSSEPGFHPHGIFSRKSRSEQQCSTWIRFAGELTEFWMKSAIAIANTPGIDTKI